MNSLNGSRVTSMKSLAVIILALILSGCGMFQKRSEDKNPLVVTECPATLEELNDPSFGATVQLMVKWANQYHSCRSAALAGVKK